MDCGCHFVTIENKTKGTCPLKKNENISKALGFLSATLEFNYFCIITSHVKSVSLKIYQKALKSSQFVH